MGVPDQLVDVKLGQAKEICRSFKSDLDHYENRGRVASAGEYVVNALRKGIDGLLEKLEDIESSDELKIWSDKIIESKIHRLTQYIHEFVEILSLLESSRVRDVPYEVASPLKKEVRNIFPDSELLVVSTSRLNYSILELGSILRERLRELDCDVPSDLPDKIFRVAIPSTTYKKALLLAIFSHELGHPMYNRYNVEQDIMPIDVNKSLINKYIEKVEDKDLSTDPSNQKAKVRGKITDQINETIHNWAEEIAADLFALNVFGPSYLYAFIYLVPTISRLDSAGKSHPPPRVRLKHLIDRSRDVIRYIPNPEK